MRQSAKRHGTINQQKKQEGSKALNGEESHGPKHNNNSLCSIPASSLGWYLDPALRENTVEARKLGHGRPPIPKPKVEGTPA